jgi:hypothetical protein
MTLFPDTQAQATSDGTRRGPRASRLELYGVGIALAAGLGVVALVGQDNPSSYAPVDSSGPGFTSAYSRPTEALGGQTLAGYLADHYSDRVARRLSDR